MPKTTKSQNKKSSASLKSKPNFSKKILAGFGAIFAVIGAYFLVSTFAGTEYIEYFGSLTGAKQSVSYRLTTGAGEMSVNFKNNTADIKLTITDANGNIVGSAFSKGRTPVDVKVTVVPGVYKLALTTEQPFTNKKGYALRIYYPGVDTTTPSAIITSPLNKEFVAGTVDFTASSVDDVAVTKVEFYVEGVLLNTDISAPYSIKWDTTKSVNGETSLLVKSYDSSGNVAEAAGSIEVKNTSAVSKQRFPGDPNPKVNGKAYWGAAIAGNGDPAKHEGPTGRSLSVRRTFWQWDAANNMNSSMYKTIEDDLKNNRLPFVSIKTPGWTKMGNGTYDAELDTIIRKLDSYGKPIWFIVFHEPEGGAGSNVPNDPDGAPAWRAMQIRIRQRMNAVKSKNVAFMPVIMSYTWNPASGRNPEDWWVEGIWDAYIVDHYVENETRKDMYTDQWNSFVKWVEKKGLPYGTAEWGNRGTDVQAGSEMQAFWDWGFNNKKDVIVYTYFDSSLNSPNGSWELKGEQLNVFQKIMKSDNRVQRINQL
jgi:hypothetical protein